MPATPEDLFKALEQMGIKTDTITHPAVFTVEDSKALRGEIAGAHVKNLFLKDKKGQLFLISALEDTRIDLKTIHDIIGGSGRVSFCSADQLRDYLGVEPGSVTPFAVFNDHGRVVRAILDQRLVAHERINVHPLVNTMTTGIARDDLIAFMTSTGHKPAILPVGQAASENS